MRSDFYVYALLDPRRPGVFEYGKLQFLFEPFYVGKGTGNRDRSHFRLGNIRVDKKRIVSPHKVNKILKILEVGLEPITVRIRIGLTESKAFDYELKLIERIGRKPNGPLTNATAGGEGVSGYVYTAALLKKRSIFWKNWHANLTETQLAERSAMFTRLNYQKRASKTQAELNSWYANISAGHKRRTPEEREALTIIARDAQYGLDTKAWNLKNQRTSEGLKRYRKSMSLEAKVKESQTLSEAQRRYWSSIRKEERQARADAIANGYARKDKASLAAKNAKISAAISKQHTAQSLYDKRMRAFMVMCGVMIRNAQNDGREFDVERLKDKLRARAAKYYAIASNLDTPPTELREQVRSRIPA